LHSGDARTRERRRPATVPPPDRRRPQRGTAEKRAAVGFSRRPASEMPCP